MNKYKLLSSVAVFARKSKAYDQWKTTFTNGEVEEEGLPIESIWQAITYIFKPRSKLFHFQINEDVKYLLIKKFHGEKGSLRRCQSVNILGYINKSVFKSLVTLIKKYGVEFLIWDSSRHISFFAHTRLFFLNCYT